jgi:hypothetical protein
MDTQTVIDIIKMIDVKVEYLNTKIEESLNIDEDDDDTSMYWTLRAGRDELQMLSNHLQSYIEGQLNAAENQTVE